MSRTKLLMSVLMMALLLPAMAMAQDNNPPQNNDRGSRRGNWDPAQFRQRIAERMKAELKCTDEEWTVLQPKIDKIMTMQRDMRGGGMGMMFGGRTGGRRPGGDTNNDQQPQREQSEVAKAATDLRTALQDENTPAATIDEKLLAYRTAKAKAEAELEAARKDLKELLTPRQEANLVMMGILE